MLKYRIGVGLLAGWCIGLAPAHSAERMYVAEVRDGHTAYMRAVDGYPVTCRLHGVTAPVKDEHYGKSAAHLLAFLIERKSVKVKVHDQLPTGRYACRIWREGREINLAMVEAGQAWVNRATDPEDTYLEAEHTARESGLGLWASDTPVAPEQWKEASR